MAYNTKEILKDIDGNPISQYYNSTTDKYEPVEGSLGANKVVVENNDLSLIPILDKLGQLTGTVIDENTRKTNEVDRKAKEVIRESNESTRKSNETARVNQENTRKTNETARQTSETARKTEESKRVSAESGRVSAESTRVSKENTRDISEISRINAESLREDNEVIRKTAESGRISSEITRANKEDERQSQESTRQSQESTRETNEDSRKSNESQRIVTENTRKTDESTRINNENTRQSQESTRQSQESSREFNEDLRIALYDDLQSKLTSGFFKGEKGNTGNGLEYNWMGTSLGVKVEGDLDYIYVNLKGETGDIESLDAILIRNALGYVPANKLNLDNHIEDITSIEGKHGIRYYQDKLEVYDGVEWIEIKTGGGSSVKLGNVSNLSIEAQLGKKIKVTWTDPNDVVLEGITLAPWGGTQLRRKLSTYPIDEKDGELVVDSKVRDQYSTGYLDSGLVDGQKYFYALFPYTLDDVFTVDVANRVDATAFEKYTQSPPSKPIIGSLGALKVTISSDVGSVVSLNRVDWFISPHEFTGLTENETYIPYAKFEETADKWESDITPGDSFVAINKLPQDPPPAPTLSDLEFDKATITGVGGTEVKLGDGEWLDSPQAYTGLTAETEYEAFARMKETSTKFASDSSLAKEFTTPSEIDPNSWAGIQAIVRKGLANDHFTVGDQIASNYDGDEIIWEVIGIDIDTPADPSLTHSMTLQTKDCLHDIQFDAPEPSNPDSNRKSYGNNRYTHSAVKQWLNSNETTFIWQSQHQYDAKPTANPELYDGAGFLNRLDPELAGVLGEVNKKVALNTVTDGGGQEEITDKVFLLSPKEVGYTPSEMNNDGDYTGEFVYPFYDGKGNTNRIKNLNHSPRVWWLRSPVVSYSSSVRCVTTGGPLSYSSANHSYGLSPACTIC